MRNEEWQAPSKTLSGTGKKERQTDKGANFHKVLQQTSVLHEMQQRKSLSEAFIVPQRTTE